MDTMEKTRKFPTSLKVAGLLAVLVLITTIALSGTLAKYTSTEKATAQARVAAYEVGIKDKGTDGTINLYDTLYEADVTKEEKNVKKIYSSGSSDKMKIIAPGTGGKCPITVFSRSEVDVEYTIVMTLNKDSDKRIPVEFRYQTGTDRFGKPEWSTWKTLNPTSGHGGSTPKFEFEGELLVNKDGTFKTENIQWRWPFTGGKTTSESEAYDKNDTALGTAVLDKGGLSRNAPKLIVDYNVTFTQID